MRNPERIDRIANLLATITNDDLTISDVLLEQEIGYYTEDDETEKRLSTYPKVGYNIYANKLCYYWKMNYPDLRLGQLILNIYNHYMDISDSILVSTVEKYYGVESKVSDIDYADVFLENYSK